MKAKEESMKYFRNTELARLYHVSEKSVRNWIDAAQQGKLDLQLYEHEGKQYVGNTTRNITLIDSIVVKGQKYKNNRSYQRIAPTSHFYKIFTTKEIFDIFSNLDKYREVPHQYSYFNGGAVEWDLYAQRLAEESGPNLLTNTVQLLEAEFEYIDNLLLDYKRINFIDIGVGNALPVRGLLEHYLATGRLNRYIGIDASKDMLDIAERNIKSWFGHKIKFEGYARDINYERLDDLVLTESFDKNAPSCNVMLFFGSTIANFRKPGQSLYTIHESMGRHDLLLFSMKLDTPATRRYFDLDSGQLGATPLPSQEKFVLDLLNITPSLYEVEQFFDEQTMARRMQVRLKIALAIDFEIDGQQKVIQFNKGESILLWHHKQQSMLETIQEFNKNGFELLQATRSKDQECLLSISRIKTVN